MPPFYHFDLHIKLIFRNRFPCIDKFPAAGTAVFAEASSSWDTVSVTSEPQTQPAHAFHILAAHLFLIRPTPGRWGSVFFLLIGVEAVGVPVFVLSWAASASRCRIRFFSSLIMASFLKAVPDNPPSFFFRLFTSHQSTVKRMAAMLVILYPVFQAYDFCRHPLHANIFAIAVNHKKAPCVIFASSFSLSFRFSISKRKISCFNSETFIPFKRPKISSCSVSCTVW